MAGKEFKTRKGMTGEEKEGGDAKNLFLPVLPWQSTSSTPDRPGN